MFNNEIFTNYYYGSLSEQRLKENLSKIFLNKKWSLGYVKNVQRGALIAATRGGGKWVTAL